MRGADCDAPASGADCEAAASGADWVEAPGGGTDRVPDGTSGAACEAAVSGAERVTAPGGLFTGGGGGDDGMLSADGDGGVLTFGAGGGSAPAGRWATRVPRRPVGPVGELSRGGGGGRLETRTGGASSSDSGGTTAPGSAAAERREMCGREPRPRPCDRPGSRAGGAGGEGALVLVSSTSSVTSVVVSGSSTSTTTAGYRMLGPCWKRWRCTVATYPEAASMHDPAPHALEVPARGVGHCPDASSSAVQVSDRAPSRPHARPRVQLRRWRE